jgi:predicted ATPase with chaperone activity
LGVPGSIWPLLAVGVLVATGQLPPDCTATLAFCGELGLNGSLRHVPGMIALADATAPLVRCSKEQE